jgi:PPOX class probable F420-dependent enzyme
VTISSAGYSRNPSSIACTASAPLVVVAAFGFAEITPLLGCLRELELPTCETICHPSSGQERTSNIRKRLQPDDLGDLLVLPNVAVLATYRRDGSVLLSPVWHEWLDGGFNVVTGSSDIKAVHLRHDPRASIVVCDDAPPYRGIELRTTAQLSLMDDRSIVRRIATRYLGPEAGERYVESGGDDLLVRLEPGELRAWDFTDDFP